MSVCNYCGMDASGVCGTVVWCDTCRAENSNLLNSLELRWSSQFDAVMYYDGTKDHPKGSSGWSTSYNLGRIKNLKKEG